MIEHEWAIEWRNEVGAVRWQPAMPNGACLVVSDHNGPVWSGSAGWGPWLYKSRTRAERVANRHWRRVQRETWRTAK